MALSIQFHGEVIVGCADGKAHKCASRTSPYRGRFSVEESSARDRSPMIRAVNILPSAREANSSPFMALSFEFPQRLHHMFAIATLITIPKCTYIHITFAISLPFICSPSYTPSTHTHTYNCQQTCTLLPFTLMNIATSTYMNPMTVMKSYRVSN